MVSFGARHFQEDIFLNPRRTFSGPWLRVKRSAEVAFITRLMQQIRHRPGSNCVGVVEVEEWASRVAPQARWRSQECGPLCSKPSACASRS